MATRAEVLASDYEPYDHRERKDQTSAFAALVNLIKGILGAGALAMPAGYLNSGLIGGTVGFVLITILITYCLQIMFQCLYYFCKRDQISQMDFPEGFKEALKIGPKCLQPLSDIAPYFINFFIIVYQVGIMCVYFVFIPTNVKQVVDLHTPEDTHLSVELYMVFFLIPLLLLSYIKNLKVLAPVSNVANWVTLGGLFCIYYFVFREIEPLSERNLFSHPAKYPLFVGTTLFAGIAIGAVLSIEKNMKDGRVYVSTFGVLNTGMFVVGFLNMLTGFLGYWKYGDETESVVTLNIDPQDPVAQAIRILFSVAIYFSYPLQAYPAVEILWEQYVEAYMENSKCPLFWDYVLRTILVFISFLLAVAIPRLGLFISLFGAFCLTILCMVIPPFMDMCIRWPKDFGRGNMVFVRDLLIIIFGFFTWGSGTYIAIYTIVISFMNE